MKIKLFYTGSTITAKGRRAKSILRKELQGSGFGLNDVITLRRGEWRFIDARLPGETHDDGTTLSCSEWQPERGYARAIDCYDESWGRRWDRFSVLVK